jgi:hypothetical protein
MIIVCSGLLVIAAYSVIDTVIRDKKTEKRREERRLKKKLSET